MHGCLSPDNDVVLQRDASGDESYGQPCYKIPSIPAEAAAAGLTWKYYGTAPVWDAPQYINGIKNSPQNSSTQIITDAKANNLLDAFNFEAPPRPPVLLAADLHVPPAPIARSGVVYLAYSLPGRMIARFAMRGEKTLFLFVFTADHMSGPDPQALPQVKTTLRQVFGRISAGREPIREVVDPTTVGLDNLFPGRAITLAASSD